MAQSAQATIAATRYVSRSWFYPTMAGLILLIVLAGFSPTLYLRALFDVREMPPYLYVHGILLTAWFVLFFLQTLLVAGGSTARHRTLGIAAVTIGAVIPLAGLMATFGIPDRVASAGLDVEQSVLRMMPVIVGNIQNVVFFAVALLCAVLLRHKREFHSRLMLWASLFIIGPALGRIWRWPVFADLEESTFISSALYLLMAVIVGQELWRERKVHRVTVIALGAYIGWTLVQPSIVGSEWAKDLVLSLA